MEHCYGCNAEAARHPIVGVMHATDVRAGADILSATGVSGAAVNARGFVGVPVCTPCHVNPDHRAYDIKAHFFEREHATVGLVLAGSASAVGG